MMVLHLTCIVSLNICIHLSIIILKWSSSFIITYIHIYHLPVVVIYAHSLIDLNKAWCYLYIDDLLSYLLPFLHALYVDDIVHAICAMYQMFL
jgi:hypothetical protein